MYVKQVVIQNETGLHARPASLFVRKAKEFSASITIKNLSTNSNAVNAKSMMMLLTLGCVKNSLVEICGDGENEQQAVDALVTLIDSKFGE